VHRKHGILTLECLDPVYPIGCVPTLQTRRQSVSFLLRHRGHKIPSPGLLRDITQESVKDVKSFAERGQPPLIRLEPARRRHNVAAEYREAFDQAEGVVFIGAAEKKANAFKAQKNEQQE